MIPREQVLSLYNTGPQAVIELVTQLCQTIEQLQGEITALKARVTALEDQRATNSRNSSKPPSSDGFARQPRSLRQPTGAKPGGQPGHQGATLQAVAEPDQRLTYAPAQCRACGMGLKEVAGRLTPERRQ